MCVAENEKRLFSIFSCGCNHTNLSTITGHKGTTFFIKEKEIDV